MQKAPQEKISGKGRLGALALMSSLLVMIALTITYLPNWLNDSASLQGPAAHAREKADAEIQLRFEQGVAMLNAKQYDYALTSFHRVLQLAPNLPEAHVNMGFALLGLKRYAIARDFFESAIELRKDQMNAYYGLSEALSGMNDIPGALGAMRTYVHRSPPDDPYRRRADAAIWELESKLAEERKKSASDNNPDAKQGGSTQKDSAKTP
jgi:tetratricopeptide (TPR) repeat protein